MMQHFIWYAIPYVFGGLCFWAGWAARAARQPRADGAIRESIAALGNAVLANADHVDHGPRH